MRAIQDLMSAARSVRPGVEETEKAAVVPATVPELFDAIVPRIRYRILECAIRLKQQLRLPWSDEQAELTALRSQISTYATTLVLEGDVWWPIDDMHPWIGTFRVPSEHSVALGFLRESELRRRVTAAFIARSAERWRRRCSLRVTVSRRFKVLDEFERVVLIGTLELKERAPGRRWLRVRWCSPPAADRAPELERRASQHAATASYERGWDNFSTAQHEDRLASELRELSSCARYAALLLR